MPEPIPHSRPWLGRAEQQALARVIASRQLAQGREVERLEEDFAATLGFRHAVAVSSGSAALHLALLALGVRPGDRVLTPSYVCVAVLNSIRHCRARELLVDAEQGGFNLDADAAASHRARAAVVPHLFGYAARVRRIAAAGIPVIEDCAMSLGATSPSGRPLGHAGRIAAFSFYATKVVAGGEGGLVATDERALAAEVRDLRAYDKTERFRPRFNYKLTELQAALVRVQLGRLERAVSRRRALAERYFDRLDPEAVELPPQSAGASYSRFVIRVAGGVTRAHRHFAERGIEVARPVFLPLHRYLELPASRFPRAEQLFLTALSLPIYPDMTARDALRVAMAANTLAPR